MEFVPTGSAVVLRTATPPLTAPVPSVTVPFLKVTVPVALPPPMLATVAVKLTDLPCVAGFSDETSVVVVPTLLTTSLTAADVLVAKFASPL